MFTVRFTWLDAFGVVLRWSALTTGARADQNRALDVSGVTERGSGGRDSVSACVKIDSCCHVGQLNHFWREQILLDEAAPAANQQGIKCVLSHNVQQGRNPGE